MTKKNALHGLYVLSDRQLTPPSQLSDNIEQALLGGCRIVQYRDKSEQHDLRLQQATDLKRLCEQYQALFIINDDIELACQSGADGVHLGKDDNALALARERLGQKSIIGISCYNELDLAINAELQGADYVAFGSFFASTIKPQAPRADLELLRLARLKLKIPVVAIGGIEHENAGRLIDAGADMLAVISAVFAGNNIEDAARRFSDLF